MLTFERPKAGQYAELMELMMHEGDYLRDSLRLMQMTQDEFDRLFRTVGQVFRILIGDQLVGFYWIEQRDNILHLHGLMLKEQFQGKGIGTQILHKLISENHGKVKEIELGVHESNLRAIGLYERNGFDTVTTLPDLKFRIMKKNL